MNYSGLAYTLGLGVASTGGLFVLLSPFLGWVAVFLSGSDTSGNALFGNLQVVAAKQLGLNPVLFAATNSSGGVMGKMISPQNIATGVSVTDLKGQEGAGVRAHLRALHHSRLSFSACSSRCSNSSSLGSSRPLPDHRRTGALSLPGAGRP